MQSFVNSFHFKIMAHPADFGTSINSGQKVNCNNLNFIFEEANKVFIDRVFKFD